MTECLATDGLIRPGAVYLAAEALPKSWFRWCLLRWQTAWQAEPGQPPAFEVAGVAFVVVGEERHRLRVQHR